MYKQGDDCRRKKRADGDGSLPRGCALHLGTVHGNGDREAERWELGVLKNEFYIHLRQGKTKNHSIEA